jgi:hypothetical protein
MDAERLHDLFENARQIRERARRVKSHQLCLEAEKFTTLRHARREPEKNQEKRKVGSAAKPGR